MHVLTKEQLREQLVTARNINKQLEHELSKFQWISVDSLMPEQKKRVLTIDSLGVQRVIVWDMFEDTPDWYGEEWEGFEEGLEITHWMPLPEAPTNSKDK